MTTPLFPPNNGPISIRQGMHGDCYLLASLDCILNSGPDGYSKIKSLFTEVPEGVLVRLRHNDQSSNLNLVLLGNKYQYSHDKARNEDVFFINRAQLEVIDRTNAGAQTNSLAIKILEHLSSHYYRSSFAQSRQRKTSLSAHDSDIRFTGTPPVFVAKILGLFAHDTHNFNEIIKIKTICPEQPIYFSMKALSLGQSQQVTERHAYRVDKITPDSLRPGELNVVLVNPWNNQARENHRSVELLGRQVFFSIFTTNPQQYALIQMLKHSAPTLGQTIFGNKALLQMVYKIQKLRGDLFNLHDIEYCVFLNQQSRQIPEIFKGLSQLVQHLLIDDMSVATCNLKDIGHLKILSFFTIQLDAMQKLGQPARVSDGASLTIWVELQRIELFLVSFDAIDSDQRVSEYCTSLIDKLKDDVANNSLLIDVESKWGVSDGFVRHHPMILQMIDVKVNQIQMLADKRRLELDKAQAARESYGLFKRYEVESQAQVTLLLEDEEPIWGSYT